MIEYIKNILPRLAEHSKDLNRKENFVEKRWVLLDTDNNVHEYFFKRDGTLLLFVNGNGTTGNWEMLDQGRRIMVEFGSESKLLQAAFVNDGLFLLKKSSSNELAFALFDPDVIAESDIEKYIETFFSTPEKEMISSESIPSGFFKISTSGHILSNYIEIGDRLLDSHNNKISGTYQVNYTDNLYAVVKDNTVYKIYRKKTFYIKPKGSILIQVDKDYFIQKGSLIEDYNASLVLPFKPINVSNNNQTYQITVNEKGEVISIEDQSMNHVLLAVFLAIFLFLFIIYIGTSGK